MPSSRIRSPLPLCSAVDIVDKPVKSGENRAITPGPQERDIPVSILNS